MHCKWKNIFVVYGGGYFLNQNIIFSSKIVVVPYSFRWSPLLFNICGFIFRGFHCLCGFHYVGYVVSIVYVVSYVPDYVVSIINETKIFIITFFL